MARKHSSKNQKGSYWDKNLNKISIIIASISLILTIAYWGVDYYFSKLSHKEDLLISISRSFENYPTTIIEAFPSQGSINVNFVCRITNNSEKPVTIMKYETSEIFPDHSTHCYGIYDRINSEERKELPLRLEPYETQKVILKIGLSIDSVSMQVLKSNLNFIDRKVITEMHLVESLLREHATDIYGNKGKKKVSSFALYNEDFFQQKFRAKFTTSEGNSFTQDIAYYPLDLEITRN